MARGESMVTWAMHYRPIWMQMSWKRLKIEALLQWDTNRKYYMANWMVVCSVTSCDPVMSSSWHQYVGPIILNLAGDTCLVMTSCDPKSQGHPDNIRIEISRECCRWHWTDFMFFWTLSCFVKNTPKATFSHTLSIFRPKFQGCYLWSRSMILGYAECMWTPHGK